MPCSTIALNKEPNLHKRKVLSCKGLNMLLEPSEMNRLLLATMTKMTTTQRIKGFRMSKMVWVNPTTMRSKLEQQSGI